MALSLRDRRDRPILRIVLAAVFLAMAVGQLSDVGGFARILREYRVFPRPLVPVAAVAFPALEATAGLGMLRRSSRAATLGVVVTLAWSVLAVSAFARGIALDNCGCFGVHVGQTLRWWVLLEDAEWVLLMVIARRSMGPVVPTVVTDGIGASDAGFPARADVLGAPPHRPPGDGLRRR